tara:strand:- start:741 stop:1214 length:474 start_codon:yes stop_codon:yes gene_type:complete
MHTIDKKIKELELILPKMANPIANYLPFKISKNIVYISGQAPIMDGKIIFSGKIGDKLSIEDGINAAKLCCMNILSIIKYACNDDWNNFNEIVKIGGFVNCKDNFTDHPKIINGASNLLVEILGDKGKHARFAVGSNSLPLDIAVEIEAVVSLNNIK